MTEPEASENALAAELAELSAVADRVLLAAPEVEPSLGFAEAVLARIESEAATAAANVVPIEAADGRRRRWYVTAAAAAVVLLAGLALGLLAAGDDTSETGEFAMINAAGEQVATLLIRPDSPNSLVVLDAPTWRPAEGDPTPRTYHLDVRLDDGSVVVLPGVDLEASDGNFGALVEADEREILSVALLDQTGRTWCSAELV